MDSFGTEVIVGYGILTALVLLAILFCDGGSQIIRTDWDDAVRFYAHIKVTYTLSPSADDRWQIKVNAFGQSKTGIYEIESWDLGSKRHQLDAESKARGFVEKLREQVAAAQTRKMRSRTTTVPL